MIPFLILASALAMLAPMDKTEPPSPACADTVFVAVYRHSELDQPIPICVDDSVHVYDVGTVRLEVMP